MFENITALKTAGTLLVLIVFGATLPVSAAEIVGPGSGGAGTSSDTGSGTFVDQTGPSVTLAAGTYDVTLFEAAFGQAGVGVRPFLATTADSGVTYTTIWVGPDVAAPGSAGASTNPYALGTQQFTLLNSDVLFAGFQNTTQGASPISFTNSGSTDITNPPLTGDNITGVGQTVSANNQNLPRTYDFAITVAPARPPTPVPALSIYGLGLLMLGMLLLAGRRLRIYSI